MNQLLVARGSTAAAVTRARASMREPVLELGRAPAAPTPRSETGPRSDGAPNDVGDVLADGVLCAGSWDRPALARLCRELGERRLFVVEPTAGLGLRRVAQWLLTPWWRHRLGYDFNRDLASELRAAGFQFHAIDRFSAGRSTVRTYFYGVLAPRRHPLDGKP